MEDFQYGANLRIPYGVGLFSIVCSSTPSYEYEGEWRFGMVLLELIQSVRSGKNNGGRHGFPIFQ
eukprot:scaffold370_cov176-Amphora_coffeaeformis.AAC.8